MELRTFHSKNFDIKVKRWWSPSARKAARLTLLLLEHHSYEIKVETQRLFSEFMLYGESLSTKKWNPNG